MLMMHKGVRGLMWLQSRGMTSLFLLFALLASSQGASVETRQAACNTYVVAGIPGGFTQRLKVDFSTAKSGDDVAALLR